MEEKIYTHSLEYAMQKDETADYHASAARNRECAAAIDAAISASNYEQYHYDLSAALKAVTKDFGLDRVAWVMASTVQHFDYDGRYSRANKEWARSFPIPGEKGVCPVFKNHPIVLDGFTDKVRQARLHELAQTVGAYEKSHHMADRNRLTDFHADKGVFVAKRGVTEQRLTERRDEISEKQSVLAQLRAERKAAKAMAAPEKKPHEAER